MNLDDLFSSFKTCIGYILSHKYLLGSAFFVFMFILVTVLPYFFSFYAFFTEDTSNPFIETEATYLIWENGNQIRGQSDFEVSLTIVTINLEETQNINFKLHMKFPIVDENDTVIGHDYESYNYDQPLFASGWSYHGSFGNYSEGVGYSSHGMIYRYPYDFYVITYTLFNISEVFSIEDNDFFVRTGCKEGNMRIDKFQVTPPDDENSSLIISVLIKRNTQVIVTELTIPLIILGGIFITTIICNPCDSFLDEEDESDSKIRNNFNEKVQQNRKFRIDTAKWILALCFANLLFIDTAFSFLTIKRSISISTLGIACAFYFTSKNQGDRWGFLNLFIGVFSIGICFLALIYSYI